MRCRSDSAQNLLEWRLLICKTKLSSPAALGALAASTLHAAATPERPNILYIFTDDHSYRTLSCYKEAYPWAKTPNFDRLAKQGVRFLAAYNGAWCMPSRTTMLTGRHSFGIESMRMEGPYPGCEYDPKKVEFWPKVFCQKAYFTAQIGKLHTGTDRLRQASVEGFGGFGGRLASNRRM